MKKTAILLCLVILAALLVSCRAQETAGTEPVTVSETVAETTVPETAAETTAAAETEAPTEAVPEEEPVTPVHVYKNANTRILHDEEGNASARCDWDDVILYQEDAEKYPELAKALADRNAEETDRAERQLVMLQESYLEFHQFNEYFTQAFSEGKETVLRADSTVVSMQYYGSDWTGGAHPNYGYTGTNYDTKTGRKLKLTDVVTSVPAFLAYAQEKIDEQYAEDRPTLLTIEAFLEGTSPDDFADFVITNEGVRVYFSPYALGPYAAGAQIVEVYFDEHPELFAEKYVKTAEDYVIPMDRSFPVWADGDGDGTREQVGIEYQPVDDYSYHWLVKDGDRSFKIEDWCYSEESFLVRSGGKYYMYIFGTSDNDWKILRVVDLSTMTLVEGEYMSPFVEADPAEDVVNEWEYTEEGNRSRYSKACFTDPADFTMREHAEVFSTATGYKNYHAGADGKPESDDPMYVTPGFPTLRTKVGLECEVVDESGKILEKETVPAGTFLTGVRTDGKNFVDVQVVDPSLVEDREEGMPYFTLKDKFTPDPAAKTYRLWQRKADGERTVNDTGLGQYDVLDGIMYAG